ncbi:hypothetical protein L596_029074 [Steinernema carpocapsae]|uniref:Uncharacterized protein n=1 Tax=Steinernema carpocapsae TaxID=34508 RepID=A0A4U5LTJ3_STECR|nr:hypothetical protein L596_029074 [Steinernema carpocapsae]
MNSENPILTKLKSVLTATKFPKTAKEIDKLYKDDWLTDLPFKDLGYTSVEALLRSMHEDVHETVKNGVSYFVKKLVADCPMSGVRKLVTRTADDTAVQKERPKPVKKVAPSKTSSVGPRYAPSSSTISYPSNGQIYPGISPSYSKTSSSVSSEPRFTRDIFWESVFPMVPMRFSDMAYELHSLFGVNIRDSDFMNRVLGTRQTTSEDAINESFQGYLQVVLEHDGVWVKLVDHNSSNMDNSWAAHGQESEIYQRAAPPRNVAPQRDHEIPVAASETESDTLESSDLGEKDIYDEYVEHLLSFMVKGADLYSGNIPKILAKQFQFKNDDVYDEDLLIFVENLVARSEGKMKLKFINNLAFLELAEESRGNDYVNHQFIQCESLVQILDNALLNTSIDAVLRNRVKTKTVEVSDFLAFAEASRSKEDVCSIM